ncbi:hypothetical protein J2S74_003481 [Evansella vedderi]|uniref:Uncharacterized protein n=1 Tax=Evansella vedderi TaxID=38282 RepID=A0ABT9ZXW6_9BACI|nr:hypothetical protein [Evansella vedderi]MDQ0256082.1 hypothetical protein [Evansella vedderi]
MEQQDNLSLLIKALFFIGSLLFLIATFLNLQDEIKNGNNLLS